MGDTAPAYRLILDAEGGSRFTQSVKCYWNPVLESPPVPGTGRPTPDADPQPLDWHTCIVVLTDFSVMQTVLQWLTSGQHPFRSVVIDSVTELQKRVIDQTSGITQPTQADWGNILRVTEDLVRRMRDLLFHPTRPLECVVLIALTHLRDGKFRPFVKGQLELTLPGFIDVVGYLYVETGPDGQLIRKLMVAPLGDIDAKDRTHVLTATYGPVIQSPDLNQFLNTLDGAPPQLQPQEA